mmetsp:Transcript_17977/g.51033  ORF Transcript_17977/g.51033 Transcript_17977/m.51033 type:complete len:254 (-) Transcript_17977:977-1738(-)
MLLQSFATLVGLLLSHQFLGFLHGLRAWIVSISLLDFRNFVLWFLCPSKVAVVVDELVGLERTLLSDEGTSFVRVGSRGVRMRAWRTVLGDVTSPRGKIFLEVALHHVVPCPFALRHLFGLLRLPLGSGRSQMLVQPTAFRQRKTSDTHILQRGGMHANNIIWITTDELQYVRSLELLGNRLRQILAVRRGLVRKHGLTHVSHLDRHVPSQLLERFHVTRFVVFLPLLLDTILLRLIFVGKHKRRVVLLHLLF